MNEEQAKALRAAFPKEQVLTLPKTEKRPALPYVSHAAVTDRLLTTDREWSWAPMVNANGMPVVDLVGPFADPHSKLGLWIVLTVGGVTKSGYGDGKNMKEAISDALRNAAMRFGVALDLWAKEDLHGSEGEPMLSHRAPDGRSTVAAPDVGVSPSDDLPDALKPDPRDQEPATPDMIAEVREAAVAKGLATDRFDAEAAAGITKGRLWAIDKWVREQPDTMFKPPAGVAA